jgi:hypothetical protein
MPKTRFTAGVSAPSVGTLKDRGGRRPCQRWTEQLTALKMQYIEFRVLLNDIFGRPTMRVPRHFHPPVMECHKRYALSAQNVPARGIPALSRLAIGFAISRSLISLTGSLSCYTASIPAWTGHSPVHLIMATDVEQDDLSVRHRNREDDAVVRQLHNARGGSG